MIEALTYEKYKSFDTIVIEPSLAFLPNGEKMIISYNNLHSDIENWLLDNYSDWRYDWDTFDEPRIYFNNKEEAMGFLLRWI